MEFVIIFAVSLAGGVVHGITGFGYGMLMMSVLALILPFRAAAAVMMVSSLFLDLRIVVGLYKHINWKIILFPLAGSFITRTLSINLLMKSSEHHLRVGLGILMIILAVFFILAKNIKINPSPLNGVIVGLLAGLMDGVFGFSGPPLAIYCFAATKDSYEYNATLNVLLGIMGLHALFLHLFYSNINSGIIAMSAVSIAALFVGSTAGLKIFRWMNKEKLQKVICSYMALIGVLFLLKH